MRRLLIAILALLLALFPIVGNLATNKVELPPSATPWLWAAVSVLVLVTALIGSREVTEALPRRSRATVSVPTAAPTSSTVLGGGRQPDSSAGILVLLFCMMFLAAPVVALFSAGSGPSLAAAFPIPVAIGLTCCAAAVFTVVFRAWRGAPRDSLEITDQAVTFRRGRTALIVPWADVREIGVERRLLGGRLVATPVPGSLLLTSEPTMSTFHARSGRFRICDLPLPGIPVHAVEAALTRHRP